MRQVEVKAFSHNIYNSARRQVEVQDFRHSKQLIIIDHD
jgi:hypothetical protein